MSELGRLIQEFRDQNRGLISNAEIGRQVGLTRGAVGNWIDGLAAMPGPEPLRRFAIYTGIPYTRVLQAALADAGYTDSRSVTDDPPTTTSGSELVKKSLTPTPLRSRTASRTRASERPPADPLG